MKTVYSTYEAKAKLSEILRRVRSGQTIQVSYRGELVAEIRPLRREPKGLDERVQDLRERGRLVRSGGVRGELAPVAPRPGALRRFLEDRNE